MALSPRRRPITKNCPQLRTISNVNGNGAFIHTSYNDYKIFAANIIKNNPHKILYLITNLGLFIDPPLGRIGMTETQACESGKKVLIGKIVMAQVGRAHKSRKTEGLMKVLVDTETNRILHTNIFAIGGDEASIYCSITWMPLLPAR